MARSPGGRARNRAHRPLRSDGGERAGRGGTGSALVPGAVGARVRLRGWPVGCHVGVGGRRMDCVEYGAGVFGLE
eukprot:ctg_2924.g589